MNKVLLILTILINVFSVNAQSYTDQVDSLNQLINSSNDVTSIAKWELETSWLLKRKDLEKSITIAENSLKILEKSNDQEAIAIAYSYLGVYYYLKQDYSRNFNYLVKAEKLFSEQGNELRLSKVYNNLGNTYSQLYDLPTAIKYYNKALSIKEKSSTSIDISPNLINIGTIHYDLGNFQKCIELNERALIICLQSNDFESIAIIYSNLGAANERIGEYKKSINFLLKSLEIYHNEFTDYKAEIRTYTNLGSTYLSLNKLSDARFYYNQGLSLNKDFGSMSLQAVLLNNLAELERQAKNIPLALSYVKEAILIASNNQNLEEESVGYNELYLIEKDAKDYRSALTSYIKYIDLSDSLNELYNVNKTKTTLLQTEIEFSKTQKEKDLLNLKLNKEKDRVLTLLIYSFSFTIVLWLITFFKFRTVNWLVNSLNYLVPVMFSMIVALSLYQTTSILADSGSLFLFGILIGIILLSILIYLGLNSIMKHSQG